MPQIDEGSWSSDNETPGEIAMLLERETILAGLWRTGGVRWDPFEVPLDHDETIYVLSGTGDLQVNDGPPLHMTPGFTTTIPAGSLTRWTVDEEFSEVWIYH
jgi:uncharacterized cupin superfamily protein